MRLKRTVVATHVVSARSLHQQSIHRKGLTLPAALALSVYLSPAWESSLQGLLEVLGAKETLETKAKTYKKKEVRKLAEEIAGKACA